MEHRIPKQRDTDSLREAKLGEFAEDLRRAKLSRVAISHYLRAVRRGFESGDMLRALREAKSPSAAKLARAGLLRFAQLFRDSALARRIPKVPYVRAVVHRPRLDEALRMKILTQIGRDLPAREYAGTRLALRAAPVISLIDLLATERAAVLNWDAVQESHLLRATLANERWDILGDLLAIGGPNAAYAALRRIVRRACEHLGIPYVRPHEFRVLARRLASVAKEASR